MMAVSLAAGGARRSARWRNLPRNEVFAAIFLLGTLNGLVSDIARSVGSLGLWTSMFQTFEISGVLWIAIGIGISMTIRGDRHPITRADAVLAGVCVLLILVPIRGLSWIAVALLAIRAVWGGRRQAPVEAVVTAGAGAIFLGAATAKFLTPLFLDALSGPALQFDAAVAGAGLGFIFEDVHRSGNLIDLGSGISPIVVMTGCSSLTNLSYGLLTWLTLTRWISPRWRPRDLVPATVIFIGAVIINIGRISVMGLSDDLFKFIHDSWGASLFNGAILALAFAATWLSLPAAASESSLKAAPR